MLSGVHKTLFQKLALALLHIANEQGTNGHVGRELTHPSDFHKVGHHYYAGSVFVPHHPPEVVDGLLHRSCSKTEQRFFFFLCMFATGKFLGLQINLSIPICSSPTFIDGHSSPF